MVIMNVSNQVVLITGASSGIGRATAIALSKHHNVIAITARRAPLLESVAEEIRSNGSTCEVFVGDAIEESHGEEVVSALVEKHGRIDIAILNIGIGPPSNTLNASAATITSCMRSNYDTMINFYVPLIRQMKAQTTRCMISHMNSQASYFGIPMQGDYTATKGAARLFLDTVRMELQHFGVRHIAIQTIHPGFVDTEACKDDGIPETGLISEEQAAAFVLRGLKNEISDLTP
jgi:NADP-dependent 3-hydroxy acid dehydrogenase YdfG